MKTPTLTKILSSETEAASEAASLKRLKVALEACYKAADRCMDIAVDNEEHIHRDVVNMLEKVMSELNGYIKAIH